ncbi:MAG: hypothetical protein MUC92_10135 [Fimbriimonadaceae bacterium]|jgi:hypothetical protein|nr:hypothetical protein [Fimbriimonadaceae bacterium]
MSFSIKGLIGIFVTLFLVCGGGSYLFVQLLVEDEQSEAQSFGRKAVLSIARSWDSEALMRQATEKYRSSYSEKQFAEILAGPSQTLGPFVKGKSKARLTSAKADGHEEMMRAEYENHAEFAKGKAVIRMTLEKPKKGNWLISEFRVDPPEG